jgi:hypothetical protein
MTMNPPAWVADWLAGAADPDHILPHLQAFPVAVRATLARLPPACVAQWVGPRLDDVPYDAGFVPELGQHVIVVHVLEHDELGVVLLLLPEPDGPVLTIAESRAPLAVVGYRGGLTPDMMGMLRAGSASA